MKRYLLAFVCIYLVGCTPLLLTDSTPGINKQASTAMNSNKQSRTSPALSTLTLRQVINPLLTKAGLIVVAIEPLVREHTEITFSALGEEGICYVIDHNCSLDLPAFLRGKSISNPESVDVLFSASKGDYVSLSIKADISTFVTPYLLIVVDQTALFSKPSLLSVLPEGVGKGELLAVHETQGDKTFIRVLRNEQDLWIPRSSGRIQYQVD